VTGGQFTALFGRFEYALKRMGLLRKNQDAQADWSKFAEQLGPTFFEEVVRLAIADTLIKEPPRKLMRDGLKWLPENPNPLKNVIELFEQGVCRVRNNLFHGEKFIAQSGDWERDARLVGEALAVLRAAQDRVPAVAATISRV
jgi:hypothetical protein